jgi:membrane-associated protein
MHDFVEVLKHLLNGNQLIHLLIDRFSGWPLYAVLGAIIFSETGLLVGFFLPGDSLLFAAGVVAGLGSLQLVWLIPVLVVAAFCGDNVGYLLGRSAGPRIFSRPKSRFFNPAHIQKTHEFYDRYGPRAIVYARFVPVVRTCTPFIAGVAGMTYARFILYSLLGGIGWVTALTLLGYELGSVKFVQDNLEKVILLIVFLSLLPSIIGVWKARRQSPAGA